MDENATPEFGRSEWAADAGEPGSTFGQPQQQPDLTGSAPAAAAEAPASASAPAAAGPAAASRRRPVLRSVAVLAVTAIVGVAGGIAIGDNTRGGSTDASATIVGAATGGGTTGSATGGSSAGGITGGVTGGFGSGLGGGLGDGAGDGSGDGSTSQGLAPGAGTATGNSSEDTTTGAAVASKVDPGLVDIVTTITGGEAAGTGMVLTSTGEILTNNHVITGASSIKVTDIGNGKTYTASVVGYDLSEDVAVLQLTGASGLTTVSTASSAVASGTQVVGVGNAGGTGGTPSYAVGTVTGLGKSITASDEGTGSSEQLTNLIETDADIQAGDSGGPLVNSAGQVVGMDTAGSTGYSFTRYGGSSSDGYAIPIATALSVAKSIEAGQSSSTVHIGSTAELGIYVSAASEQGEQQVTGAPVSGVVANGPAAAAGLAENDVITAVNGVSIASPDALSAEMTQLRSGQTVKVAYTDESGAAKTTTVTLGTGVPQ